VAKSKLTSLSNALPQLGDPLSLADGRVINPDPRPGDVEAAHQIAQVEPKDFKPAKTRSLKELPADPTFMRGVCVIFVYTMLGLSDAEMAINLGISPAELRKIRASRGYAETFEAILEEFVNANSTLLKSRIASYSHSALTELISLALTSKKEDIRLKGVTDILNRAGATSETMQKQQGSVNELRISVTKAEDAPDIQINTVPAATAPGSEMEQ
jgi:hypothetical protein